MDSFGSVGPSSLISDAWNSPNDRAGRSWHSFSAREPDCCQARDTASRQARHCVSPSEEVLRSSRSCAEGDVRMKKPLPLLVAVLGLAGLAGCIGLPALARADEPRSVVVRIGDLDLSKPQGLATLHRRLENAARKVCEPLDGAPLVQKMLYRRCVAHALDAVVAKHPMLAREPAV